MGLFNKLFGVAEKGVMEGVEKVTSEEAERIVSKGEQKVVQGVKSSANGEGPLNLHILDERNAEKAAVQAAKEAEAQAAASRSERIFTDESRTTENVKNSNKGAGTETPPPAGNQTTNESTGHTDPVEDAKKKQVYETRKVKDKSDYLYNKGVKDANAAMDFEQGISYDKLEDKHKKVVDNILNSKGINMGTDAESKAAYGMYADEFLGKDAAGRKGDIDGFMKANSSREMTWGENMGYHKVPQKVAGIGGTAFLISSMSGSKGQQSNGELYGQQTPYGR